MGFGWEINIMGFVGSKVGITSSSSVADDVSTLKAAYSVRKYVASYTGSAIRVRRADNQEQDIGFNGNDLDESALTTFCSGTDGFVKIWYDQSGNGLDAAQLSAAS